MAISPQDQARIPIGSRWKNWARPHTSTVEVVKYGTRRVKLRCLYPRGGDTEFWEMPATLLHWYNRVAIPADSVERPEGAGGGPGDSEEDKRGRKERLEGKGEGEW
jgi:hypothetical protein